MNIIALAWIYVVLLMSFTEHSVIAGIMTFLIYCVLPLSVILYLIGTPMRKRKRDAAENLRKNTELPQTLPEKIASAEPPQQ